MALQNSKDKGGNELMSGRRKAVTKREVLAAIKDHQTTSVGKLVKILKVGRATVYRRINEISEKEIKEALGIVADNQLKPVERDYGVFCQIKEIVDFYETLRYKRETGQAYADNVRRTLWRTCLKLNLRPSAFVDLKAAIKASDFITAIKKGEITGFNEYTQRKTFRAWFTYNGISGQKLTNLGIHARHPTKRSKGRSKARFTQEQRHRIRKAAEKYYHTNWVHKHGRGNVIIPFGDNPNLGAAMNAWFEFKYYTMTRKSATLNCTWEYRKDDHGLEWGVLWGSDDSTVTIKLVDKGKRGGIPWDKKLVGQAAINFKAFWESIGSPEQGRIFPFNGEALRYFQITVYKDAGIPEHLFQRMPDHIWRHTGAQDALDATGWNYGLVAVWGGWESIDVLKREYGEMPADTAINAIRRAMGEDIPEIKREFVF
jgi:integrase